VAVSSLEAKALRTKALLRRDYNSPYRASPEQEDDPKGKKGNMAEATFNMLGNLLRKNEEHK